MHPGEGEVLGTCREPVIDLRGQHVLEESPVVAAEIATQLFDCGGH